MCGEASEAYIGTATSLHVTMNPQLRVATRGEPQPEPQTSHIDDGTAGLRLGKALVASERHVPRRHEVPTMYSVSLLL